MTLGSVARHVIPAVRLRALQTEPTGPTPCYPDGGEAGLSLGQLRSGGFPKGCCDCSPTAVVASSVFADQDTGVHQRTEVTAWGTQMQVVTVMARAGGVRGKSQ